MSLRGRHAVADLIGGGLVLDNHDVNNERVVQQNKDQYACVAREKVDFYIGILFTTLRFISLSFSLYLSFLLFTVPNAISDIYSASHFLSRVSKFLCLIEYELYFSLLSYFLSFLCLSPVLFISLFHSPYFFLGLQNTVRFLASRLTYTVSDFSCLRSVLSRSSLIRNAAQFLIRLLEPG